MPANAVNPITVNPITVEVVRNAVNAHADEMATALCKSAYNMMIYEVRDFCCGLIDTQARMISQNKGGLPIFLADLGIAVQDGIDRYGLDGFVPGDVIIMNHGLVCGQHLNNVVIYAPCFHDGKVVAFAASRVRGEPRPLGRYRRQPGRLRLGGNHRNLSGRPAIPLAQDL
jgi:N-methylhydantoinase B